MGITESKISLSQGSHIKTKKPSGRSPDVRTVPQCLEYYAKTLPYKDAVVFASTDGDREAITFKEVFERSRTVASNLLDFGIKRHEIVAINLGICPEMLYVMFGSMMAGLLPFPIPFTYQDGSDVIESFERVKCCSCVVMDRGYNGENWEIFSKLLDSYSTDGNASSTKLPSLRYLIGYSDSIPDSKSLDDLMVSCGKSPNMSDIQEDDIAILLQSSGSTGVPKVVPYTHASLMTFADIEKGPAFNTDGPLFCDRSFGWIGGFPLGLLLGQTRVTYSGLCPPPKDSVGFAMDVIRRERCHSCLVLPSFISELVKRKVCIFSLN